ncbi:hypothetical protein [Halobaculum sp. MBLA0143]|uniref:hypothetical protein n=1 Tax=Halobaculum sp. MBLA0143 TaxID=3079933 RepID=UPI003525F69F
MSRRVASDPVCAGETLDTNSPVLGIEKRCVASDTERKNGSDDHDVDNGSRDTGDDNHDVGSGSTDNDGITAVAVVSSADCALRNRRTGPAPRA